MSGREKNGGKIWSTATHVISLHFNFIRDLTLLVPIVAACTRNEEFLRVTIIDRGMESAEN